MKNMLNKEFFFFSSRRRHTRWNCDRSSDVCSSDLSMAAALSLPRTYGVVVSDVLPGSAAEAAGVQIGDVLAAVDGKSAENLPLVAFHFYLLETGDKVHLDIFRGKDRLVFDVPVMEPPRDMDQITALADPERNRSEEHTS